MAVRSGRHPHSIAASVADATIFDILRKVLSSKVDRDESPVTAVQIKNSRILNRKINSETTVTVPCGYPHEKQQRVRKKRSRKGQQADALALEGEEGRDKLR